MTKPDSGFGASSGSGFADFADFDNKVRTAREIWHVGSDPKWNW